MLDEIKITSNGIPDNLDTALRYSMPIDGTTQELAEKNR